MSLTLFQQQQIEPPKGTLRKQFVVDCSVCYKVQIIPMYPLGPLGRTLSITPSEWLTRQGWNSKQISVYDTRVDIYTCPECAEKTMNAVTIKDEPLTIEV